MRAPIVRAALDRPRPEMGEELRRLYDADQSDRDSRRLRPDLWERDRARRRRVQELIDSGALVSAEDHYHAAMVFQHGDEVDDYLRAHQLAVKAVELGHRPARWLAAAAYDRWLHAQGRPQKYGTQYRAEGGRWVLSEVDPATTDAERAEWDVPPLAEARRRAADIPLAAPPGSPRVLLEAKLPELHVQLVDMRPPKFVERFSRSARPEPLGRDETVRWMPGYLPEGVTVMKFGGAYAATRGGEPLLTWVQAPVRPRLPVMLIVDPASGTPRLHVREQEGRQVLVVEGAAFVAWAPTGWTLVLTPAGPGAAWMVAGTLPVEELARVLLSLPSQPS